MAVVFESLKDIARADPGLVGAKAKALAALAAHGFDVPEAAARIHTGARVTVDGYLGIVRIRPEEPD